MNSGAAFKITHNPFYVLGLRPDATRAEIEREGQKLLGMLELGLTSAMIYRTPVGDVVRDADSVRKAMAELRDPERRLEHELWARLEACRATPPGDASVDCEPAPPKAEDPWPDARVAFGFRVAR